MSTAGKTLLWWGRFDPAYARNHVLRHHLAAAGTVVRDFHPRICLLGDFEAAWRGVTRPDAVWVPCFRQRDVAAARRWCDRHRVPLLFDPLISAYDKQVWERFKFGAHTHRARRLLAWEQRLFSKADLVLADTPCHATFFAETLRVPREKIRVVYVGADETSFRPVVKQTPGTPVELFFYGSFIPLHGAQILVEAARCYSGPPVRWHLLGDGPTRAACRQAAAGMAQVVFENPIPYAELPARIQRADILLGIFGATRKASRVIPNKVFQALACGRPVITRASEAYPVSVRDNPGLALIPPDDPAALAAAVRAWASTPEKLAERGAQANALYGQMFSGTVIAGQVRETLAHLLPA